MWLSIISKSLVDISGNLILVKFGGIFGSAELDRFFGYRVEVSRNFRLVDPSKFFGF